jgi:hypothetical protein
MGTSRKISHLVAAVVTVLAASCSGGPNDTLPAEWSGAQSLATQQSACRSDGPSNTPTVDITETAAGVAGTLSAWFRCPQSVCAYVMDSDATSRVLVQPCDLHPTNVTKCACLFDVTFTLPARAARTDVEVYERSDFYGATTPPVPTLIATKPVGPPTRSP